MCRMEGDPSRAQITSLADVGGGVPEEPLTLENSRSAVPLASGNSVYRYLNSKDVKIKSVPPIIPASLP